MSKLTKIILLCLLAIIFSYSYCYGIDLNLAENKISNESPVGAALLGKKKNDMVEVKTPGGIAKYKVLSITK